MTPERAAEVLGVPLGSDPSTIEHAFQRRARTTHPDVAPASSDGVDDGRGSAFHEAAEARRVLLSTRVTPVAGPRRIVRDGPRIQGPGLLSVWAGLLVVAAFLAIFRAPYPLTIAEPLVRWGVLIASAIAFAATGRRGFLAVAIVAEVATVATAVLVTTFGSLVGTIITLPALLGAFTAGIVRFRLRRDLGEG